MTVKEAIEWLVSIDKKYIHGGDEWYDAQRHEAIKIAIKALEFIEYYYPIWGVSYLHQDSITKSDTQL